MREIHRGLALFCAEMVSATHRGRRRHLVGVAWGSVMPETRRGGEEQRGEGGKKKKKKEEQREGVGLQREGGRRSRHRGRGSRGQGGGEIRGHAKLPLCPSLLSFIYST